MPNFPQSYRFISHKAPRIVTLNLRSDHGQKQSALRYLHVSKRGMACEVPEKSSMPNTEYLPRDESFYTDIKELTKVYRIKEREWFLNTSEEKMSQFFPDDVPQNKLYMIENCRFYFEIGCTLAGTKPCVQFYWLEEEAIDYFNEGIETIFAPLFQDYGLSRYGFEFSQTNFIYGVNKYMHVFSDKLSQEWPLIQQCILSSNMDASGFDIGTALGYPLPCHFNTEMDNLGQVRYNDRAEKKAVKDALGAELGNIIAFDYVAQLDTTFKNFLTMLNHFQRVRKTGQILGQEIVLDLRDHPVFNALANALVEDRSKFEKEKMLLHGVRQEEIPVLDACHLDRPPPYTSS